MQDPRNGAEAGGSEGFDVQGVAERVELVSLTFGYLRHFEVFCKHGKTIYIETVLHFWKWFVDGLLIESDDIPPHVAFPNNCAILT